MKTIEILIIFFISYSGLSSQKLLDNWELTSVFEYDKKFDLLENNYKVFSGELFQIGKFSNGVKLKSQKSEYNLSNLMKKDTIEWFVSFDINENYIVVNDFNNVYIFEHDNKKNLRFVKSIELKLYLTNIYISKGKVYLFDSQFSDDNCKYESQTIFIELDLKSYELRYIPFENIEGIDLVNHGPRKMIDINNGIISISSLTDYVVKFYDLKSGLVLDSIIKISPNWISGSEDIPKYPCDNYLSTHLSKTRHYLSEISQIWRSEFINDSLFMISWSYPSLINGQEWFRVKYDIYKKKNNEWVLSKNELMDYQDNLNDILSSKTIRLYHSFRIIDGSLFKVVAYPKQFLKFENKITIEDFNKKIEEYYFENDLEYTCLVYKFKY